MTTTTTHTITESMPSTSQVVTSALKYEVQFAETARGDREGKLKLQGIPQFSDLSEKRQWMKQHMAAAFRFFADKGYSVGVSGHMSIRGMC